MTRLMGDAIHFNVPTLAKVPGLQVVAGYATGTPDIKWTAADWQTFAGQIRVSIDQGYQSPAITLSTVRDVETGAWTPAAAVNTANWTATRKTIYCNRNDLSREGGVLQSGWQGDLWLAWPGWTVGMALPTAPGCNYVAVQNDFTNPAYDLSIVLDPFWPLEGPVLTSYQPGSVGLIYTPAGQLQLYGVGQDNRVYVSDLDPVTMTTSNTKQVTFPLTFH